MRNLATSQEYTQQPASHIYQKTHDLTHAQDNQVMTSQYV